MSTSQPILYQENTITTQKCRKCSLELPFDDFIKSKGKPSNVCKICNRAATKQRYKNMMSNPDKKEIRLEKKRGYGEKWYHNRKQDPKFREMRKDWHKNQRKINEVYAMKIRIRTRTRMFLNSREMTKNWSTQEMLGCSWLEFRNHIESKFLEGMTWQNRKLWHLDHITPLSSANTPEEVYKLGHYLNIQPLWGPDNIRKGGVKIKNPHC
jgi:hypothetical protein